MGAGLHSGGFDLDRTDLRDWTGTVLLQSKFERSSEGNFPNLYGTGFAANPRAPGGGGACFGAGAAHGSRPHGEELLENERPYPRLRSGQNAGDETDAFRAAIPRTASRNRL